MHTAERLPYWEDEYLQEPMAKSCSSGEAEVGYLLPQLLATPDCPSRSRVFPPVLDWLRRAHRG